MRAFFNEFGEETNFDARVSVFRGSCGSLECVEQDDSLRWDSTAGELYSMLVHSADGSSGNFGLFVDLGMNSAPTWSIIYQLTRQSLLGLLLVLVLMQAVSTAYRSVGCIHSSLQLDW